jgi:hypothetical protein
MSWPCCCGGTLCTDICDPGAPTTFNVKISGATPGTAPGTPDCNQTYSLAVDPTASSQPFPNFSSVCTGVPRSTSDNVCAWSTYAPCLWGFIQPYMILSIFRDAAGGYTIAFSITLLDPGGATVAVWWKHYSSKPNCSQANLVLPNLAVCSFNGTYVASGCCDFSTATITLNPTMGRLRPGTWLKRFFGWLGVKPCKPCEKRAATLDRWAAKLFRW